MVIKGLLRKIGSEIVEIYNQISSIGILKYYDSNFKFVISLTNIISALLIVLTLPFAVAFIFVEPLYSIVLLFPIILYFSVLAFNLIHKHLIARIILSFTVVFAILFTAGVVEDVYIYNKGYNYLLLAVSVIPFVVFRRNEYKWLALVVFVEFLVIVFSEEILNIINSVLNIDISVKFLVLMEYVSRIYSFVTLVSIAAIVHSQFAYQLNELKRQHKKYKALKEKYERQSKFFERITLYANDAIIITRGATEIIFWNKAAEKIFGYKQSEVKGKNPHLLLSVDFQKNNKELLHKIKQFRQTGKSDLVGTTFKTKAITKYRQLIEIEISLSKVQIGKEYYGIAIIREVSSAMEKYYNVMESLEFVYEMQRALFRIEDSSKLISKYLGDNFIYWQPMSKVGGDFLYVRETKKQLIVAVGDCTGHGIPGAFMTMINIALLNQIIGPYTYHKPNEILAELSKLLNRSFRYPAEHIFEGTDLAIITFDKHTKKLAYSGAYIPLYIYRSNKKDIEVIKPDRKQVAIFIRKEPKFTLHILNLNKGDIIYMLTDGLQSQFGGKEFKKFKRKRVIELFKKVSVKNTGMHEKKQEIEKEFLRWKGANEQTDDILIVGIKLTRLFNIKSVKSQTSKST